MFFFVEHIDLDAKPSMLFSDFVLNMFEVFAVGCFTTAECVDPATLLAIFDPFSICVGEEKLFKS